MFTNSATADQGFIISDSFKKAWDVFRKEWITVYLVQILPLAVAIIYNMFVGTTKEGSFLSVVLMLAYMLLQFIVSMGLIKAYLEIVRGKKVSMNTFSSVAPKIFKFVIAQFLMMFIILGGLLLFIIPGIIFSIKYMFTPYLMVDKDMGPVEALKASAKMTDGVKWDLVGFLAAVVVLMYSGVIALLVGLIITIPVGTLAYVVLYDKLLKRL